MFTIFMLVLYDAVNDTSDEVEEMQDPVYHFGHHISLYRVGKDAKELDRAGALEKHPSIFIQVYAKQSDSKVSLLGCGSLLLSTSQSHYDIDIPTCRPISYGGRSETLLRLRDCYLGPTLNEVQSKKIMMFNRKKDNVTEASGTVSVRVQNISTTFLSSTSSEASNKSSPILKESIDEVLSRLRRHKRERAISDALCNSMDSTNVENLKISKKTRDVLERAKARKEARAYA